MSTLHVAHKTVQDNSFFLQVATDARGKVQYCNENIYMDNGYVVSEVINEGALVMYNNCYDESRWDCKLYNVTTDTASNTWCRAPGKCQFDK